MDSYRIGQHLVTLDIEVARASSYVPPRPGVARREFGVADDPGIDDEAVADEFAEQISPPQGQAGGWRGFLSRWGG